MTQRARSAKTPPPSLRLVPRSRFVSPRGLITPPSERRVQPYRSRGHTARGQNQAMPTPIIRSKSPAPVHPASPIAQAPISPIVRKGPISGKEALSRFASILTQYELKEIMSYPEIYYVGVLAKKIKPNRSATVNFGFDLATHHYRANTGDHIAYRYEIRSILGKGAFGQVLRCMDHKTKDSVALKIIVNTPQMKVQGEAEISMLNFLNEEDPNGLSNIVRVLDSFHFRNHACLVFEVLGQNLYEFSRTNFFKRAAIGQVRQIGRQVLRALQFTHGRGIVHCDMKPENVLLLIGSNTKVKVIDYGSACYIGQKHFDYIQSRFYRAPEVMLGIKYGPPMDIWSFACVIAELAMGRPLFPGENECHQLQLQMQVLGPIPSSVMNIATRREVFFDNEGRIYPVNGRRKKPGSISLQKATGINDLELIDLLQRCLEWDQNKRITASEAVKHPFFETNQKNQQIEFIITPRPVPKEEETSPQVQQTKNVVPTPTKSKSREPTPENKNSIARKRGVSPGLNKKPIARVSSAKSSASPSPRSKVSALKSKTSPSSPSKSSPLKSKASPTSKVSPRSTKASINNNKTTKSSSLKKSKASPSPSAKSSAIATTKSLNAHTSSNTYGKALKSNATRKTSTTITIEPSSSTQRTKSSPRRKSPGYKTATSPKH